jgi:ribonuclease Z
MAIKFVITLLLLCAAELSMADDIEITLLGTGGPSPTIERFGPSTVIETQGQYFVFDAGRGTTIRLQQAGIPLDKIEHVFLTHLHSDHITGLSDLWLSSWIWQRQNKMQLFGPPGTKDFADHLQQAFTENISLRTLNSGLNEQYSKLIVEESAVDNIVVYQKHDIKITAFHVNHGVVKHAYGYKFESHGRKIIISGDTAYSENLIKHAKNADILIHEIAAASKALLDSNKRLTKIMAYHTDPDSLALVLNKTQAKHTILTHVLLFGISQKEVLTQLKNEFNRPLYFGKDLLKISIGESIVITAEN